MARLASVLTGLPLVLAMMAHPAAAQDVPGIEICTAEKSMERRTSCLQSNINFLKANLTKLALDSQQRLDAANRQIEALKATVAGLQKTIEQLQTAKTPASDAKDAPKAAPTAK